MLKVQNEIALNIDAEKVKALTLLDLSAAFETIDYSVILDCLSDWYGIIGIALTWIHSFLVNEYKYNKYINKY